MRRQIGQLRAFANAGFALAILALGGYGLYQVAGRQWRVQPTFHVRTRFATSSGVEAGHRVRLQGMDAGVVERVVAPGQPGESVELVLRLDERLRHLVRSDAVARILAEWGAGMLQGYLLSPLAPAAFEEWLAHIDLRDLASVTHERRRMLQLAR